MWYTQSEIYPFYSREVCDIKVPQLISGWAKISLLVSGLTAHHLVMTPVLIESFKGSCASLLFVPQLIIGPSFQLSHCLGTTLGLTQPALEAAPGCGPFLIPEESKVDSIF